MQARYYQLSTVDSIKLNQVNLCVLPMRAGKSFIMFLAVDRYKFKKVLIIVGYRKIVEQLANYFPSHTHILSGMPFDHSKQVHLASFQTLANRDIDLSEYDCIIQDEYHSRTSQSANDVVFQPNCTVILFTGTPLTNTNKLLTSGIDNFIQPITIREMLENNWLAPTKFFSNSTIISDNSTALATSKQDFDESVVRQIIQKEHLLENILQLIDKHNLDTQHKTLIYVNYIATANELYELIKHRNNVFVVHSQLSQSEQDLAIAEYQQTASGVLINVRALSLGFNSESTDTIIYATFTKIHSLALQILWRASTIDPSNPNKVATVYDMTGQLAFINPYTDFKSYSSKLPCPDQCKKQYPNDPLAQFFCLESCKTDPILVPCRGELPYSLRDNPLVSNFTVFEGTPCMESRPMWDYTYKQTNPFVGTLRKWSKCACGCITFYDVQTLTKPAEMVQVYDNAVKRNTITVIFSEEHHKALALFDDITKKSYKILMFESSQDLYEQAIKFFKNQPFQILANVAMPRLPNVSVEPRLNEVMPAIRWESDNLGFVRHLIRAKLTELVSFFGMKSGYVYYTMKGVTDANQKRVLEFLNSDTIDRNQFVSFCKSIQPKE